MADKNCISLKRIDYIPGTIWSECTILMSCFDRAIIIQYRTSRALE